MVSFLLPLLLSAAGAPTPAADPGAALLRAALDRRAAGDLAGGASLLSPDKGAARPVYCGGPLEPWCALQRARCLFHAGHFADAAADFSAARALDPDGPVGGHAHLGEAEARLQAGEVPAALALLEEIAAKSPSPEALSSLAAALLSAGQRERAVAVLTRLYLEHPASPASRAARRRLGELDAFRGLDTAGFAARSARLAATGYGRRALAGAQQAARVARGPADEATAIFAEAKALAALRRHAEVDQTLGRIGKDAPLPLRRDAAMQKARSALSRGDLPLAREGFDEVARLFPGDPVGEEAAFLSAWSFFNQGDAPACAARFARFLDGRPRSRRADEALWYRGLCLRLSGDAAGALQAFSRLERASPKLAQQAVYWRARTVASKAEAEAALRAAVRMAPAGWYAWLARLRLVEMGAAPEPFRLLAAEPPAAVPTTLRERRAVLLAGLGLSREAGEELAAGGIASGRDAARAAGLASSLGHFDRAYRLANAALWGPAFRGGDPVALGLLFPRALPGVVRPAAAAVDMDPHFLWAIMRRESAFDPTAESVARALGLMQLLQPTARKIAHLAGEPRPGVPEMHRPERLVPLAAWYLADLIGRFGHAALGAAAYNGGPGAVARWVASHGERPVDEMVELIPYKETRLYVKGVLGDYFTYRALWGAEDEPLPFSLTVPATAASADF